MKKEEKLSERQIAKTFEIVKGFNIGTATGEKRFDPGKVKPKFVMEADFEPEVWKNLLDMGAVRKFEDPTIAKEGEQIVAVIEE